MDEDGGFDKITQPKIYRVNCTYHIGPFVKLMKQRGNIMKYKTKLIKIKNQIDEETYTWQPSLKKKKCCGNCFDYTHQLHKEVIKKKILNCDVLLRKIREKLIKLRHLRRNKTDRDQAMIKPGMSDENDSVGSQEGSEGHKKE